MAKIRPGLIEQFDYNCNFTPDAVELENTPMVPLFVYDGMMRKHPFHSVLENEGAEFQLPGYTVDRCYRMWMMRKNGLTLAMNEPEPAWKTGYQPSHVSGELYYVPGAAFMNIDKYMKNGLQFERVKTMLVLPKFVRTGKYPDNVVTLERRSHLRRAWMYVARREYWDPIIDWHGYTLLRPKQDTLVKQYYALTEEDYTVEDS